MPTPKELAPPQTPKTPPSPKFWVPLVTMVGTAVVLGLIEAVTPGLFSFLGQWEGIAYTVVTAGLGATAAWLKTDPLRSVGAIVSMDHEDDGQPHYGEVIQQDDENVLVLPPDLDRKPGPDHRAE